MNNVMSQAQILLNTTPVVQDIPNFEYDETGYTSHWIKRNLANSKNRTYNISGRVNQQ